MVAAASAARRVDEYVAVDVIVPAQVLEEVAKACGTADEESYVSISVKGSGGQVMFTIPGDGTIHQTVIAGQ